MISLPGRILIDYSVKSLSAGSPHVLALTESGVVLAWGGDSPSFLGVGKKELHNGYNSDPDSVMGLPVDIIEVAAGTQFSIARSFAGGILGWGYTEYGELGFEQKNPVVKPIQLNLGINAQGISAGLNVIGVYGERGLFMRGDGLERQMGCVAEEEGNSNRLLSDVKIEQLDLGGFYALAVSSEGKIYSWGRGSSGQLGSRVLDDPEEETGCPRPLTGIPGMVSVSAGAYASAAIDSTGRIWTWGSNELGELGRPDSIGTEAHVPPGPVVVDPEAYPKDIDFDL